jgi:hypothetical protein
MAQLTIYLDTESHRLVEEAATREGSSLSRWARVRLVAAAQPKGWPDRFFNLFGAISDESFEEPEDLVWKDDAARIEL